MSQELAKTIGAPLALTMGEQERTEMMAAFAKNCADGNISEFTLSRIKIANGMAQWVIEDVEGEKTEPFIQGVIVHIHDVRTYYPNKQARNVPPECSSRDGKVGFGKPGGECAKCALAQWDSAEGDSSAQACKQGKVLLIFRGDNLLPDVVHIPPTSIKAVEKFGLQSLTKRLPYHHCVTRISLVKAQSKGGDSYGKAVFEVVRRLSPEEIKGATQAEAFTLGLLYPEARKA